MHTATNCYLFSLAISDTFQLVLGLPPELYTIWEAYPWRFGEPYCLFKTFLTELMSTASVLTILAFTVERYIAICHPLRAQAVSTPARAVKTLLALWVGASLSVLPYPLHTRTYYYLSDPRHSDARPLTDSLVCNIPLSWMARMKYVVQASTLLLFAAPMCAMTVLYVLIALALRRRATARASFITGGDDSQPPGTCQWRRQDVTTDQRGRLSPVIRQSPNSRRTVLRILVAVLVTFFICWAPFHAQRVLTVSVPDGRWTSTLIDIQSTLFYVSGSLTSLTS